MLSAICSILCLTGLPSPNAQDLQKCPGGVSLVVHKATDQATHRIIHIRNWHFVRKDAFVADLQDLNDNKLSEDELDERYIQFLNHVEAIQKGQRQLLEYLIDHHGLKTVFLEGISEEELPKFNKFITTLRDFDQNKPKGETPIEQFLLWQYRRDRLEVGAAGQLLMAGRLEAILPAEEAMAFKQANPVGEDGKVTFDEKLNEAREDAIVRQLLKGGPIAVVILGGGHDLSDNAAKISSDTCEVITVSTKAYRAVAE